MTEYWLEMVGWDQMERGQGPFASAEAAEAEAARIGWRSGHGVYVRLIKREPDGTETVVKSIGNPNDGREDEE